MTGEDKARWERLEHTWAKVPKATVERLWAALADRLSRLNEGDRPLREYIQKARRLGKEEAADVADALRASDIYDSASPDRMPKLAAALAPIPDPRGRPETWGEEHFTKLDGLNEKERADKIGVIVADRFPNLTWPEAKGRRDSLLKAYKKARDLNRRQK